jgi:trimethylamine monooxygenase
MKNRSSGESWPKWPATKDGMTGSWGDDTQGPIDATGCPGFDIEGVKKTFIEREHHKHQDIMGFRNDSYRLAMTGARSTEVSPALARGDG